MISRECTTNKPIPVSDLVDNAVKLIKQRAIKYQERQNTQPRGLK